MLHTKIAYVLKFPNAMPISLGINFYFVAQKEAPKTVSKMLNNANTIVEADNNYPKSYFGRVYLIILMILLLSVYTFCQWHSFFCSAVETHLKLNLSAMVIRS